MIAEQDCLTVTQLTTYIKRKFDYDPYLTKDVYVVGQLTDFRARRGHQYFALKDETDSQRSAKINVVMFKGAFDKLKFAPENGMKVIIRGRVSVYEPTGNYQLYADSMEVAGLGSLQIAFQQMYDKLKAEGLFDRPRKSLRPFPKRIAVVTSLNGAVMHDIITTIRRRNPLIQLVFYPAKVQGDGAAATIARQIQRADQPDQYDALIVARGGGSLEDLWPFNEEIVGRAIAAAQIPVISSIGHETDTTIADLAADLRAPTPTAAAEQASAWELSEVLMQLQSLQEQLFHGQKRRLTQARQLVDNLAQSPVLQQPSRVLARPMQQVDEAQIKLTQAFQHRLYQAQRQVQTVSEQLQQNSPSQQLARQQLAVYQASQQLISEMKRRLQTATYQTQSLIDQLAALSPLTVLQRGYSYVTTNDQVVSNSQQLTPGETVKIHFAHGTAAATITEITTEETTDANR